MVAPDQASNDDSKWAWEETEDVEEPKRKNIEKCVFRKIELNFVQIKLI